MPPRLRFYNLTTATTFGRVFSSKITNAFISYYDVLKLPHTASTTDIKNRFYELSKRYHPDRNRNDPQASKRFVMISSAYNILSKASSREKYDQELGTSTSAGRITKPFTATGGRSASGLSRRRTQYRAAPSFPRDVNSNGYRGKCPHESGTRKATSDGGGGIGVGGIGKAYNEDVPHFNWEKKYKQHQEHERRQSAKAKRGHPRSNIDPGLVIPVFAVCSILFITVWAATYTMQPKRPKVKG